MRWYMGLYFYDVEAGRVDGDEAKICWNSFIVSPCFESGGVRGRRHPGTDASHGGGSSPVMGPLVKNLKISQ